ncbi:hypothetical protein LZ023_38020 (plasmid) [Pseudomonas silvicola]|nr:hypothetical protein LZ023_38020 [Pseudomonas silvicola]
MTSETSRLPNTVQHRAACNPPSGARCAAVVGVSGADGGGTEPQGFAAPRFVDQNP